MIIFLVEKVSVNWNTYKNGWIYLLVIITIICYLNFTEPLILITFDITEGPSCLAYKYQLGEDHKNVV